MIEKQLMIEAGNIGKDKVWVGFPRELNVHEVLKKSLSGDLLDTFSMTPHAARAVIELLQIELARLEGTLCLTCEDPECSGCDDSSD